jgi:hypothetical protein
VSEEVKEFKRLTGDELIAKAKAEGRFSTPEVLVAMSPDELCRHVNNLEHQRDDRQHHADWTEHDRGQTKKQHEAAIKAKDAEHQRSHDDKDARHKAAFDQAGQDYRDTLAAKDAEHAATKAELQAQKDASVKREKDLKALFDAAKISEDVLRWMAHGRAKEEAAARLTALAEEQARLQAIAQQE